MIEIAVQGGEVEAENVAGGIGRFGFLLDLDRNVAEEAGLGGVGCLGDLARGGWHGDRGQNNGCGMAIDGIAGRFLGDGGFAVLLELADDLLADEGAQRGGAAEDVGAGVVDGGENEGRGVYRRD